MSRPLTGIRVLDFTTFQAGAQGTVVLADLGADVIKVENTRGGDEGRVIYMVGPVDDRRSVFFYTCNRGKRSLSLDLKRAEAIGAVDKLVATVDVVVNNFRPGVMERLDLSYDRLRGINPRLVYVSASGWGTRGPKATHPALDTAAQARGGLVYHTGDPDGSPLPVGAAAADASGALNLAVAVLAGIIARDRTGEAQMVDLSLYGAVLTLQAPEINYSLVSGREMPRAGRTHPLLPTLTRIFATADGFLAVIGVEDTRWPGFCRAMGRDDLQHDERFKDVRQRKWNMEDLCAALDPVFRTRSTAEWIERLEAEDQVCSPVQSHHEVGADPVALDNGYIVPLDHPRIGRGKVVGSPFEFNGRPTPTDAVEPRLGEHTREVLAEAGLGAQEIEALLKSGAARQWG